MAQLLLMPDARPLERRLGRDFFRKAPPRPGVYLMRDATDNVIYVGKAKNLRQRLNNYRIANPDRMPRRHLRMVREVNRIDFQFCPSETSALAHEAELLRSLKPKFNRAGVWPGKTQFLVWRFRGSQLDMTVAEVPEQPWLRFGPLRGDAAYLHRTLARLLWLAINSTRAITDLPAGWAQGRFMATTSLDCEAATAQVRDALASCFWGQPEQFLAWLTATFAHRTTHFERSIIEAELEVLTKFSTRRMSKARDGLQMALL